MTKEEQLVREARALVRETESKILSIRLGMKKFICRSSAHKEENRLLSFHLRAVRRWRRRIKKFGTG